MAIKNVLIKIIKERSKVLLKTSRKCQNMKKYQRIWIVKLYRNIKDKFFIA